MAVLSRRQKAKIISQHLKKAGSDFDTTCEIAAIWDALKEIEREESKYTILHQEKKQSQEILRI